MPLSLLFVLTLSTADDDALMRAYREKTRAEIACKQTSDSDEVTICALRDADKKYRVPFVAVQRQDLVPASTERVLEDGMFSCGITGPFLTQCGGMLGVTMGVGFDGQVMRKRPPAP